MNAILPVILLLCAIYMLARVGVIIWDLVSDIMEHSWHPAKLACRISALTIGLFFIALLLYLIQWICRTLPTL